MLLDRELGSIFRYFSFPSPLSPSSSRSLPLSPCTPFNLCRCLRRRLHSMCNYQAEKLKTTDFCMQVASCCCCRHCLATRQFAALFIVGYASNATTTTTTTTTSIVVRCHCCSCCCSRETIAKLSRT